ncbi:hypothetical protein OG233_30890 (plasmid) [Streptomyces sp. NBC_01218]|uniref:hypothetical protein n=1 Tax=Streptomyces sp. NBC_01218 TaxID=2903780 RepID=UPI002E13EDC5|nr:hypothetical protein OG233_30890 [Streptomyces sp. NBC_01218]
MHDEVRGYLIPVDDLLAAGFRLNAPAPPDTPPTAPAAPATGKADVVVVGQEDVAGLRAELERARQEHALALAEAEHGRQLAQAEAAHLREQLEARVDHIADLQQALQALTPAPDQAVIQPSVPGQAHPAPAAPPAREPGPEVEAGDGRHRRWRRA